MRSLLEKGGVALAGLVTSVLTAVAVALIDWLTGFNVFSLSFFVVIPVGAAICGFAAASGYFYAAKFLHRRPTKLLLVQMVVIAAATQALIYWLEYQMLVVEGVRAADFISFGQYLDVTMTTSHLRIGRGMHDTGSEVGTFGYWLAFFDFIGFLVGGAIVYAWLLGEPSCSDCSKYLRSTVKKGDSFPSVDEFADYFDNVYAYPVDSAEFADHVGRDYSAGDAVAGTVNLTTTVYECPQCFGQSVRETVQVFNGRDWKDASELTRFVAMPSGLDLRPVFSSYSR